MRVTRARLFVFGFAWLMSLVSASSGVWSAEADDLWWVVLGSYRSSDLAQRRQSELEGKLLDVLSVVRTERDGAPLLRIVAGPFTDLDAARREVAEAVDVGISDAWITRLEDAGIESAPPGLDALGPLPAGNDLDQDQPDAAASPVPLDFHEDRETGFNRLYRDAPR